MLEWVLGKVGYVKLSRLNVPKFASVTDDDMVQVNVIGEISEMDLAISGHSLEIHKSRMIDGLFRKMLFDVKQQVEWEMYKRDDCSKYVIRGNLLIVKRRAG